MEKYRTDLGFSAKPQNRGLSSIVAGCGLNSTRNDEEPEFFGPLILAILYLLKLVGGVNFIEEVYGLDRPAG